MTFTLQRLQAEHKSSEAELGFRESEREREGEGVKREYCIYQLGVDVRVISRARFCQRISRNRKPDR